MAAEIKSKQNFSSELIAQPVVLMKNITKRFPGVLALDKVTFELRKGEVHALLGENGAGKSTLVKILYGVYTADSGEIYVEGKKVEIGSSSDAIKHGIVLVSQSPQLIDSLTIAENIILGLKKYGMLTKVRVIEDFLRRSGEEVGVRIDPNIEVWKLSYTQKQLVEILRAVLLGAKVLLLDEAITFLPLKEKFRFYKFIRKFAERGGSAVLITHKIYEALQFSDRITVLRLGKVVGTVRKEEVTPDDVRRMMFAERSTQITFERFPTLKPRGEAALKIEGLWVMGDYGVYAVRGVGIEVKAGEVLGIAGVAGNGQRELVEAVIGLRKADRGRVLLYGRDITNKGATKIRVMGVGFIPDLPAKYGVSLENTIEENLAMLPALGGKIIRWREFTELSKNLIKEFRIVTPSTKTPVKLLSGGNIMKVLVSRELTVARKFLVAYNPTRALDEVSAIQVRRIIKKKAEEQGIGVLMVSEDLDEVFQVSDRIAVINSGKIVKVFPGDVAKREEVEKLMVM